LSHKLIKAVTFQRATNTIALVLCLFIAFLTGIASSSYWGVFLKYFNITNFGIADPVFGHDISFYFFTLPF
ncbi:unnamed protein product, partial [marine sediment metagenome]